MAESKDLSKLNRDQLNELATQNGISDATDADKYPTKADLIEALEPKMQEGADSPDEVEQPSQNQDPATQVGGGPGRTNPTETGADFAGSVDADALRDAEAEDETPDEARRADEEAASQDEDPITNPVYSAPPESEEGFGWPRKNGKTQDIFGDGDYLYIKYVGGHTVPLSEKNFNEKSDSEILKQVEKVLSS